MPNNDTVSQYCLNNLQNASLADGFCAETVILQPADNIVSVRSILSLSKDSFLTLDRGSESVVFISDNQGGFWSKQTVLSAPQINHGLAVNNDYIYVSSSEIVFRAPYMYDNSKNNFSVTGPLEEVIKNMNAVSNETHNADNDDNETGSGHSTRTLIFDNEGRLLVSVGSLGNVDNDSFRSRIRRFNLSSMTSFPIDFVTGEVFADGIRNEVGLALDKYNVLWGVENGADKLFRNDLGGDISADNPAEELHQFTMEGMNFGYPYCFTEYFIPHENGLGRGTVWTWPSFLEDGTITDEECRTNYSPAALAMQGHSAPLGITFYRWKEPSAQCDGIIPFPKEMDGYAFIAFHGSWNRDIPTGYKVVYVPMPLDDKVISTGPIDLLAHEPPNSQWEDGFRPVDVDFDECGRLLVTSDGSNDDSNGEKQGSKIVRIVRTIPSNDNSIPTLFPFSTQSPTATANISNPPPFLDASPSPIPMSRSSVSSISDSTILSSVAYIFLFFHQLFQ